MHSRVSLLIVCWLPWPAHSRWCIPGPLVSRALAQDKQTPGFLCLCADRLTWTYTAAAHAGIAQDNLDRISQLNKDKDMRDSITRASGPFVHHVHPQGNTQVGA